MKKIYEGVCEWDGDRFTGNVIVCVILESGEKRELKHHVYHSIDGFSWGYLGSGCAELARSILSDHLGHEPQRVLYQKFKVDYIATWPRTKDWSLNSDAIESWLRLNHELPQGLSSMP